MMKLNGFAVLSLGLVMAILLLTHWGLKVKEEKIIIQEEKQQLSKEITALEELKYSLQVNVDSLMGVYGKVVKENELLKKLLYHTNTKLIKDKYDFNEFRLESATAIHSLKESVQRLLKAKSTFENTIQATEKENELFLAQAGIDRLTFDEILFTSDEPEVVFQELQEEYTYVVTNKKDVEANARLRRIRANQKPRAIDKKTLRATAFRTELERNGGKATIKGKRVKRILISFDLDQVPDEYLGEQELYLVIQDERRQIIYDNGKMAHVSIKGLMRSMKVVQTKVDTLEKKQRITFDFEVKRKLGKGYYLSYVYAKSGLLGKTSFRVD